MSYVLIHSTSCLRYIHFRGIFASRDAYSYFGTLKYSKSNEKPVPLYPDQYHGFDLNHSIGFCIPPTVQQLHLGIRSHHSRLFRHIMHNYLCSTIENSVYKILIDILDSERSDVCIDFTLMSVVFLSIIFMSVHTVT